MQFPSPSPFPPASPPKGQRATFLTGLLFGLIWGVCVGLVEILYIFLAWQRPIRMMVEQYWDFDFFFLVFMPVWIALLLFSLCPVAGLLAARRTQRALSGTWAGLSAGAVFVLLASVIALRRLDNLWMLYYYVINSNFAPWSSPSFFILTHLLVLAVGTYLGFLGGLLGRKKISVKKLIGIFYSISMVIFGTSLLGGAYTWAVLTADAGPTVSMLWVIVLMQSLASTSGLIATILTLIEFYRARAWTQFILTFFFSGILTLIYLITGARPAPASQNSPLVAAPSAPGYVPVALAATPAQQPSALDILQQRLAKGEIDEATYQRLAVVLEKQR